MRDVEKEGTTIKKIAKESRKEETKQQRWERKKSMWEKERRKWQCVVEALFTNWMSMVIFTNKIDALWKKNVVEKLLKVGDCGAFLDFYWVVFMAMQRGNFFFCRCSDQLC